MLSCGKKGFSVCTVCMLTTRLARAQVFHGMEMHWWHFNAYDNKFLESFTDSFSD